ncbi:MAG: cupin domain-containing protein [Planctomycetota bacterium]|jgi:quercetin dioxygenase-like cupin family protein
MRGIPFTLCLVFVAACQAPPRELKIENLLQQELNRQLAPDREVIVSYLELPPNTTLPRHWHPGEEFYYCIEGEIAAELDGKRTPFVGPGDAGHIPYKLVHTGITGSKGARLLVFRIHEKGQPHRHVVEQR